MTSRIIKISLSLCLLVALGLLVDWRLVFQTMTQARLEWLGAAALCVILARLVITWRWRLILRAAGEDVGFRRLLRIVSAGIGLGSMLPTSVGPDIARGVLFHTDAKDAAKPVGPALLVSSLLLDRYAATLGTILVASLGAFAIGQAAVGSVMCGVFVLAVGIAAAIVRYSTPLIQTITPGPLRRFAPKLETLATYLRRPDMVRRGLVPATFISALLVAARVGVFLSLYMAFDYQVPVMLAFFVIPVLLIALMAPVTIGGFGLREWLLTVGFADAGVPPEVSVSVGLLAFAVQMLVSLPAIAQTLVAARSLPFVGNPRKNETS